MAKAITGRITLNLVAGILVTVVTVAVAIFWMAERQNNQEAQATQTMVMGGIEAMQRRIQGVANDYSWWEDAYNAYTKHDGDWMYSNIGSSVEDTQIADLMAIISPAGHLDYGWTIDDKTKASDLVTPEVVAAIRKLAEGMPVQNLAARVGYIHAGKGAMLIAVSRIAPVSRADTVDPATLPFFVAGFDLSEKRLTNLGKSFLIDDLRLVPEANGHEAFPGFPAIKDLTGSPIAQLVWTPPTPGYAVLRSVLLPIFVALVALLHRRRSRPPSAPASSPSR